MAQPAAVELLSPYRVPSWQILKRSTCVAGALFAKASRSGTTHLAPKCQLRVIAARELASLLMRHPHAVRTERSECGLKRPLIPSQMLSHLVRPSLLILCDGDPLRRRHYSSAASCRFERCNLTMYPRCTPTNFEPYPTSRTGHPSDLCDRNNQRALG